MARWCAANSVAINYNILQKICATPPFLTGPFAGPHRGLSPTRPRAVSRQPPSVGQRRVAPRQPVALQLWAAWGSTPRIDRRAPGVAWWRKRGQCGVAQKQIKYTLCVGYPTLPWAGRGVAGAECGVPWGSAPPIVYLTIHIPVYIYSITDNTLYLLPNTPHYPAIGARLQPAAPRASPHPTHALRLVASATQFAWGSEKRYKL